MILTTTILPEKELPEFLEGMSRSTRAWTQDAARGQCAWICADCCMTFSSGMPDECAHKDQRCTQIIQRDKREAMRVGNEPS